MTISLSTYARQGRQLIRTYLADPRFCAIARGTGFALGGLLLSAASLRNTPQPLLLGLVCAASGWEAALLSLGGVLGYPLFWGRAGLEGVLWMIFALGASLLLHRSHPERQMPFLLPAVAALGATVCALAMRLWLGDRIPPGIYLLRIFLAAGSAWVFRGALEGRDVYHRYLAWAMGILALAQVAPVRWLRLGFLGAGILAAAAPFPAAALAGLSLDLAQVTPVPMTAVCCLVYLTRLIPWGGEWTALAAPVPVYLLVMGLCGRWDLLPMLPLALGGAAARMWNSRPKVARRRGPTGVAQVRLELVSGAFAQMQQLLLETQEQPADEAALMQRSIARACGNCPNRKPCKDRERAMALPPELLHRPYADPESLPFACRKTGRLLSELRRGQEQLRLLNADRARRKEYHWALIQQYQFLTHYLQQLSDDLGSRGPLPQPKFTPEVAVCANRPRDENGDRCQWFAGISCKYYVLLTDGMGTGPGAVEEGSMALALLRRLLSGGFPAEHALSSLNSLCALRGRAGAVTVDLLELRLDTGRATLFKWGAAPSFLLRQGVPEKVGTASAPPGLSVTQQRELSQRLSLGRGEVLVLLSDGVGGEDALTHFAWEQDLPPGELAAQILKQANPRGRDDATVVTVRLRPGVSAT